MAVLALTFSGASPTLVELVPLEQHDNDRDVVGGATFLSGIEKRLRGALSVLVAEWPVRPTSSRCHGHSGRLASL